MVADRTDAYAFEPGTPSPERFTELRRRSGMTPRTVESARRGLPGTLYGVVVTVDGTSERTATTDDVHEESNDGATVGMGRIVGDGGAVYQISDVAVHPDHQGNGIGTEIMDRLMAYLEETAPTGAYVNLIADVDGFYEQWGFEPVAPGSKGMGRYIE
ncbi:Acetyltransferase (GNAT) family [Halalkaliarchaeum sp. AArc-CO]|uniref:GNAT family N-acetyltransferase n=1 Tax=unclassified Halalkaliarchaeum TaxID=2678344 RepID=UPI00217DA129|nr:MULTISPECIES: GNAT family N-acetyltransferase [unclassified Halalkaliarchaeum]MDR5674308.1 GNAT family N-acetyltransferase [Halalkaliarchaeum sp. AArc-GB]UWG50731.1 Acetyltransferase (GNAT) family [Halalkaliarchaeum sp. AArc-CO]